MGFSEIPSLGKTRFTEFLIRENSLDAAGFQDWAFCPGMLFNSLETWWGDRGKRDRPHEGLDLCLYRDHEERVYSLDKKTKIPVMYDGIVVRVVNDFLGMSVIVEHQMPGGENGKFCTIYGHMILDNTIQVGKIIEEGDIIGNLADTSKSKASILPHLHITLGWAPKKIEYDKLTWRRIGTGNDLKLLDPLQVLDWDYLELEASLRPCRDL
ncbi:peptidoglycan DD-metalloendopeptidase family protein [Thermodesulfobacteriota bacterium]